MEICTNSDNSALLDQPSTQLPLDAYPEQWTSSDKALLRGGPLSSSKATECGLNPKAGRDTSIDTTQSPLSLDTIHTSTQDITQALTYSPITPTQSLVFQTCTPTPIPLPTSYPHSPIKCMEMNANNQLSPICKNTFFCKSNHCSHNAPIQSNTNGPSTVRLPNVSPVLARPRSVGQRMLTTSAFLQSHSQAVSLDFAHPIRRGNEC